MWNLELGFSDEETVHNGFCTNTLLKLCAEGPVTKTPSVQGVVENKTIALAIDTSVFILENEDITSNPKSITFESHIDALSISTTGEIIICALDNGHVHGIFAKGFPAFDITIEQNNSEKNGKVIGIDRDSLNNFKLFCSNGSIYNLSNIDETQLYNSKLGGMTIEENVTFEENLIENVLIERVPNIFGLNEISSYCFLNIFCDFSGGDASALFISGNQDFLRFQSEKFTSKMFLKHQFQGVKKIYNLSSYIVALTNSGEMFEICPHTRLMFSSFTDALDYVIKDLVVMEVNNENIELLMLCQCKQSGNFSMKLCDFPSFKLQNEISLSDHSWLVSQPKSSVNLYYLSGANVNESKLPQEIEIKVVKETQPEERIKKLIQKGHLDEAELFGKQFNLSLQPVYKARVQKYIMQIGASTENNLELLDELLQSLLKTLKLIDDKEFFHSIHLIEIPSRRFISVYLEAILELLDEEQFSADIMAIKEQQLRLKTLDIIDPYECNRDWQKFLQHPSIMKVCISFFSTDISIACTIWKRHLSSIIPSLEENSVKKILNLIPSTVEAFSIVQWLKCFVPSIIQIFPTSMEFLVEWSINKTRSLQFSNFWPAIGLEFASKVLKIFETINFVHSDIRRQYDACMKNLRNLTNILEDLLVLKNSYNLVLTLDVYEKESMDQTTLRILERIQSAKLADLVNDFLYPIYREKGKTPIDAIIKHINFLVRNRNGFTTWIERAVILIELLHNEEEKLKSALHVLRAAPVPWPETVKPLVELRNSSHVLSTEINTLCQMQVVEAMKIKYGWETNTNDSNMKFLYKIVQMNLPDMFEDIKSLTQADSSLEATANFYCCYELARNDNIEKAIEFLNFLDKPQRKICSCKIIYIISDILEDDFENSEAEENNCLFELMKSVSGFVDEDEKTQIHMMENLLLLRRNFNIKIRLSELLSENDKNQILENGITYLVEKIHNQIQNENTKTCLMQLIWRDVSELTAALMIDKLNGLILVSKTIGNINLSCALGYNAVELIDCYPKNANLFIEFAVLIIFQQLIADEQQSSNEIDDPLAYPMAFELLKKSLLHIQIWEIEKLLKLIRIGVDIYNMNAIQNAYSVNFNINDILIRHLKAKDSQLLKPNSNSAKKRDSLSIFEVPSDKAFSPNLKQCSSVADPSSVLRCLSVSLLLILTQAKPEGVLAKFDHYITEDLKNSFETLSNAFYVSFEHLIKSKQHESWYKIAHYILEYQKKFKMKVLTPVFLSIQMKKMFRDLLAHKEPNFPNLFAMLVCEPDPKQFLGSLFNDLKSEQQKMNFFCLSERYYGLINDTEKVVEQRENRLKYFYFAELRRQDPEQVKNRDIEMMLFEELKNELRTKILSINLLEKFCDDFDLNYQSVLISQVINLLEKQEIDFEIKTDQFGKEELVMRTSVEHLYSLCEPYINEIQCIKDFAECLIHFISRINSYFYELYLCVFQILLNLKILSDDDTKRFKLFCSILIFIKHRMVTRRIARPTDIEMESWLKNQTDSTTLSKIAKYRIPFSFFYEESPLDAILKNDIDIDNCESWFPLIRFYAELSERKSDKQDYIVIATIKRAIAKYSKDFGTWQLTPKHNAFLQSVLRLLNHINDKSMILVILYSLTNNAPEGADQVEAAYECYKFATENESDLLRANKPNSNEEVIAKIKRKYPMFKIQHLLHIYSLVEDKLLQVIERPKDLIIALYHHDSILQVRQPNINQLAAEIAELSNLNLVKLQYALLEKWLSCPSASDVHELEETFYENLNADETINDVDEFTAELVTRSHYILSSWDLKNAISFLLSNVFPADGVNNAGKQLQAFECFCKLMNGDNIDEEYLSIMDQQQFISIKCVYYLKQLGFNFTIEKFSKYDKLTLLKKIWQNYADKSLAMEIIANICIGFDIHEPKIWNGVLKQMVNFNMLKELNVLVEVLSCKKELLYTSGLKLMWEYVLKAPLKLANRSRSTHQEDLLANNLFRIQGCPLVDELNLVEIAEDCVRLERPHMAAILIGLSNNRQREVIIEMVKKYKSTKLKEDIVEMQEYGILQSIINIVLKELDL